MSVADNPPVLFAAGFEFPEGPSFAWDDELFAVDIPAGRVVHVRHGVAATWLLTSLPDRAGRPNGSKFRDGILYVCDCGRKQVLAIRADKSVTVLADAERGDLVNGPNDCAFDGEGNFYFTDPNYEGRTASVYFSQAKRDGTFATTEFAAGFHFPNGVAVSGDNRWVFIAETGRNRIWRYQRRPDGSAGAGEVWCELPPSEVGPDGIAFDDRGRLFVAHFGAGRIQIIGNDGQLVDSHDAGGKNPTNIAFSHDYSTLYVTEAATKAVYSIDLESSP